MHEKRRGGAGGGWWLGGTANKTLFERGREPALVATVGGVARRGFEILYRNFLSIQKC